MKLKLEERIHYKITGIYRLINVITGESYVGQAKNIDKRIYGHLNSSFNLNKPDYNYPVHKAIRKYGIDNFEFEVLEQCAYAELNEREIYWIDYYDTYFKGYNQTKGGKQSIRLIKLTNEDLLKVKKLLKENTLSDSEIAKRFNITRDFVYRINIGTAWHDDSNSYPIRDYNKCNKKLSATNHYSGTCIVQYDKAGNELNKFSSCLAAARAFDRKIDASHIGQCCNGLRNTAYGYRWKRLPISEKDWINLINKNK